MRVLVASALLAAGCGSANPHAAGIGTPSPSNSSSPTAAPSAAPSPTPSTLCGSSSRCLALVTLRGSDTHVVRDVTDIAHPKTVSNLGDIWAGFVNAEEISYADEKGVVRAPLTGTPKTYVVTSAGAGGGPWSPDGTAVVYTLLSGDGFQMYFHVSRGGVDRAIGSAPVPGPYDCQTIENCGVTNFADAKLLYSPDGSKISFVAGGVGDSIFRLWSSDGKLLKTSDSQFATMSVWSGQSLYFRDGGGVEAWHDGAISKFLPGVGWIKPSASPAGGSVVYTVRDSAGWGHIRLVDTATRKVRELKAQKSDAAFLTSRYVWYRGERACVAADLCGPNPPFHPYSGKTYIYDLQTGTEYGSIITSVIDVWPHAA
jgi:hypothetical protein